MLTNAQMDALIETQYAARDVIIKGRRMANDLTNAAQINKAQAELIKELVSVIIDSKNDETIHMAKLMYRKYKNKMRWLNVKRA